MTVVKAFSKPTDDCFGRNITCKKDKSITQIDIYSIKDKELFFPGRKWSNVVNLLASHCLVTSGNDPKYLLLPSYPLGP